MNLFFKKIISSQQVQDLSSIIRGLDRILVGIRHTSNASKSINLNNKPGSVSDSNTKQEQTQKQTQKKDQLKVIDLEEIDAKSYNSKPNLNSSEQAVPATSFARAFEFSKLGLGLMTNIVLGKKNVDQDSFVKRYVLTDENAEKISLTLCKMRGAALKIGQALSIQEDELLPGPIKKAFEKARDSADVMPESQLNQMLVQNYGSEWSTKFKEFNLKPFAAASIGQVHKAILPNGKRIVLKIQYPGVAQSVDSDLDNLTRLMIYTGMFPKGMFLENLINFTRKELKEECDYLLEKEKQMRYKKQLSGLKQFYVPTIIDEYTTQSILAMEYVGGDSMDYVANEYPQSLRNKIGKEIMYLTLKEIFEYRYMQTDPNPSNFFYEKNRDVIYLIDCGACREYSKEFIDEYLRIVYGGSKLDRHRIYEASKAVGFLKGEENNEMVNAHLDSIITVAQPFIKDTEFDFSNQEMTKKIYKLMPVMVKNRIKAPPTEVYSMHRKLSGAYLLNMKLKTHVNCHRILEDIYKNYKFSVKQVQNLNKRYVKYVSNIVCHYVNNKEAKIKFYKEKIKLKLLLK